MIYLVGVNHDLQFIKEDYTEEQMIIINKFWDFICERIDTIGIKLIAEEMNTEALSKHNAKSYTKEIADKKTLEHQFCDPTTQERRRMDQ